MTIPAKDIVQVNPSVISAGGSALALNGMMLTTNTRVPIGTVLPFADAASVSTYFGASSDEYLWAALYFQGRNNATVLPAQLWFTQYPQTAVSAYLRGANPGLTLTQLKALPASTLTINTSGVPETSSSIVLTGATSFSDAAAIIEAAFVTPAFSVSYDSVSGAFVFTDNATGAASTMDYATSPAGAASACTSVGTVLTVGGTVTGVFTPGDVVSGTDTTNTLPAGTTIVNQLTGTTGGAGTYTISAAASPGDLTSCAVTATGPLGTLAVSLKLTAATAAVLSQGSALADPVTFMNGVIPLTLNWGTFSTLWAATSAELEGLAQWESAQSNRFMFVAWESTAAALSVPDTTTALSAIIAANYGGVQGMYCSPTADPTGYAAAMAMGIAASIDFSRKNGRITMAYKYLDGVPVSVTDQTSASNLRTNGFNFVGEWGTANDSFVGLSPGSITGQYKFADEYLNQVYLNSQLQLALMTLLFNTNSIPYNDGGNTLIAAACQDPIDQALNFGSIVPGVALSASQIAQVNAAAGKTIDTVLSTRGWYLQVGTATAQVRAARGTPPITLFYMDGGSVQTINVASILVQ